MRLIDADKLIKALDAERKNLHLDCDYNIGLHNALTYAKSVIITELMVDAERRMDGEVEE